MPSADPIPSLRSRDYNRKLYVERSDQALRDILDWVAGRTSNSAHEPVFCIVQAPPGYGKSWILAHATTLLKERAHGLSNIYVLGPMQPPDIADAQWLRTQQERFFVKSPHAIDLAQMRFDPDAPVLNVIEAMVEDLARQQKNPHLLVVVDELDQAIGGAQFEWDVLSPCLELSQKYCVSVLIGVRSDWKFQLAELKRPAEIRSIRLEKFSESVARNQLNLLAASPELQLATVQELPLSIVDDVLRLTKVYAWTIPALNAEFMMNAVRYDSETQSVFFVEDALDISILHALRLDLNDDANSQLLHRLRRLTHSAYANGWSVDDLITQFNISLHDAARFRHRLQSLNLIERHPNGSLGFYRLSKEWNQVFEI